MPTHPDVSPVGPAAWLDMSMHGVREAGAMSSLRRDWQFLKAITRTMWMVRKDPLIDEITIESPGRNRSHVVVITVSRPDVMPHLKDHRS